MLIFTAILMMIIIIFTLFFSAYFLLKGGRSEKLSFYLKLRIGFSLLFLFVLLIGWMVNLWSPGADFLVIG